MVSLAPRWPLLVGFLITYIVVTVFFLSAYNNCENAEQLEAQLSDYRKLLQYKQPTFPPQPPADYESDEEDEDAMHQRVVAPVGHDPGYDIKPLEPPGRDMAQPEIIGKPILGQNGSFLVGSKPKDPHNLDDLPQTVLLDPHLAINNVYYVWCGRRWFEFNHYLSVMSVIKEIRPDNLIFYYDEHPVMDSWSYNTWFDEIKSSYPFFRLHQLQEGEYGCRGFRKTNMTFVYDLLTRRGGMYINEHTIIARFPLKFRNYTLVHALDTDTKRGLLMSKGGLPGKHHPDALKSEKRWPIKTFSCSNIKTFTRARKKPLCVNANDVFYPKDIWELDNAFGRLVRRIFYGDPEIRLPEVSYTELIPNIAHIVWIGGGHMDFLFYLCVLSLIYVAEVDNVYIHGDGPPTGHYWNRIKDEPKLNLIYRETPKTIYGTRVKVLSHVTDVWRVDIMLKYGGIYVDTDTVFVKPLSRHIRAYDAVGSYDWTYWNAPFPDTINFGVAVGKRNARYWHLFQESMKWFMDKDWSWNGLRQPYRIKERHPESVLIDPHLQVICFKFLCHPTWWPGYHNESVHHLNSPSIKNWREDTYAFHWTLPTPPELENEVALMNSDSMFAEVAKNVLVKAGKIRSSG